MIKLPELNPHYLIQDLDTLKVLTDPLRMQILELLNAEPQTVGQVAKKLGLAKSRLYYHFNLLEKHAFIQVVETHMVNNMLEKVYWVTAKDIDIDPELLNFASQEGQRNVFNVIGSALDATREDIMRSLQARQISLDRGAEPHPRDMVILNAKKRMTQATYQEFVEAFKILLKKFSEVPDAEPGQADVNVFSIACYLYPGYDFDEEEAK